MKSRWKFCSKLLHRQNAVVSGESALHAKESYLDPLSEKKSFSYKYGHETVLSLPQQSSRNKLWLDLNCWFLVFEYITCILISTALLSDDPAGTNAAAIGGGAGAGVAVLVILVVTVVVVVLRRR